MVDYEAQYQRIRRNDTSGFVVLIGHTSGYLLVFVEIMDILRVKKAHLPPVSSTRRRKVTSSASVDDQDGVLDPGPSSNNAFPTPVPEVGDLESTQDKDSAGSLDGEE